MSRTTIKLSARDYNKAISPDKLNAQAQRTNKNTVINGAMTVAQRGTSSASVTSSGYQTVDRFRPSIGTAGTWTITQATDVPTGYGFANSLKFDCTTANGSLSAGSDMALQYRYEGQDLQNLRKGTSSAFSVTLSFWVKSTKTGTFICELKDDDNSRQISKAYTISTTNTWEKKELTFPGDTSGALDDDNAKSLTILWWQVAGTNFTSGTLNTSWAGSVSATNRAVGQVNIADSTSNDWLITGVQLEVGDKATEFEHEPIGTTLAKCQRYYTRFQATSAYSYYGSGVSSATTTARIFKSFPVEMNHVPVLEQSANNTWNIYPPGAGFTADATINNASVWGSAINCTTGATQTANGASHCTANNTTTAFFAFESEI